MNRSPVILIGGLAAALAAGYAVRRLLAEPKVRERLGLDHPHNPPHYGDDVDIASEDSFPASDPPSFTRTTPRPT